ncbi:hypothetical protein ACS25C_04140 [Dickeya undicola]|uniref:hypothetical protein n=1 Tax=Dickeya undicola TaxID=1577887 RepID=UPI003F234BF9
MTTTAFDCDNGIVSCDTRWSADIDLKDGKYILLVDDTGFNKIAYRKGGIIICAGDGPTIESLKKWWVAEPFEPDQLPDLRGDGGFKVSVMVVDATGERIFDAGPKQVVYNPEEKHIHAVFSGSGGGFAANMFMQCGCVKSAVTTAKIFDPKSGGEVKFHELSTGANNLGDENMDYNSIMESMKKRGVLMKFTGEYAANSDNVTTIPLLEHHEASEVIGRLQGGSIRAYAPIGGAEVEWNEDRINKLREAAEKVALLERTISN